MEKKSNSTENLGLKVEFKYDKYSKRHEAACLKQGYYFETKILLTIFGTYLLAISFSKCPFYVCLWSLWRYLYDAELDLTETWYSLLNQKNARET